MSGRFSIVTFAMLLAMATSASAAPITVTLTLPNAAGGIGFIGNVHPFVAPSITFSATGDTENLYQPSPGYWAFNAVVYADIPGVVTGARSANALPMTVSANGFGITFCPDPFMPCGVEASLDLTGYNFRSSLGPITVVQAQTFNALGIQQSVFLVAPDGESVDVHANTPPGAVLQIVVGPEVSVPVNGVAWLVLLALSLGWLAAWRLRNATRTRSNGPSRPR